jgi:drug/metabolite transporter (DMT)-like permease
MALIIFHEHAMLTPMFYGGAAVVMVSVLLNAWFKRKNQWVEEEVEI